MILLQGLRLHMMCPVIDGANHRSNVQVCIAATAGQGLFPDHQGQGSLKGKGWVGKGRRGGEGRRLCEHYFYQTFIIYFFYSVIYLETVQETYWFLQGG